MYIICNEGDFNETEKKCLHKTFHNTFPGQSIMYLNASSNSATLHNAVQLITVTSYGTHMYDT